MTRICTSQTWAISELGLGALYDGGSKDLRAGQSNIFVSGFVRFYSRIPSSPIVPMM